MKLLVKNIINQIESNEITVQDIADHYNVTKRTIQSKIKSLGYKWNSKAARYDYIGNDSEPVDVNFSDLFENNNKIGRDELESKLEATNEQLDDKIKASDVMKQKEMDAVDILLNKKQKKKRVYQGFYFDPDIIKIIDLANERQKSELVNQALRMVFKEKGLL